MHPADTIVAPATPAGESALAIVRVSGPRAAGFAAEWNAGTLPPARHAWHADYRGTAGGIIDDAVFCFFPGPRSYTGEDVLEISSHGNPFIVSKIVDDLRGRGCRLAEPGEFTKRAFLNGRLDLTEAEAVMDLIRARSDRALDAAHRQLRGALRERIDTAVSQLLDLCAAVEAQVDFPEEDLPAADVRRWRSATVDLAGELRALAATRREGDLLREGVKVVLCGEPNVGKSTLFNRLVGFDRAIVSEDPGTTRDFLEERILLGGWCIRLVDTAGLREAAGAVERAGVRRTLEQVREADRLVLVVDAGRPPPELPAEVTAKLADGGIVAVNKCDLPGRNFHPPAPWAEACRDVSARTGQGVDELRQVLGSRLDRLAAGSERDDGVVVNARHEASLRDAAASLDRAIALLDGNPATELVAVDLRSAISALGEIVGTIEHDVILDRLFASFCIGK
jgi:tRNA modification GTPase